MPFNFSRNIAMNSDSASYVQGLRKSYGAGKTTTAEILEGLRLRTAGDSPRERSAQNNAGPATSCAKRGELEMDRAALGNGILDPRF
jgi:hypothetical protein